MKVYYMFQTQSFDNSIGTEETTYEQFQEEFRGRCQDPVYFEGLSEDGHGQGLGDWSDLGESYDWGVHMNMSKRDFEALKDEYGLTED